MCLAALLVMAREPLACVLVPLELLLELPSGGSTRLEDLCWTASSKLLVGGLSVSIKDAECLPQHASQCSPKQDAQGRTGKSHDGFPIKSLKPCPSTSSE